MIQVDQHTTRKGIVNLLNNKAPVKVDKRKWIHVVLYRLIHLVNNLWQEKLGINRVTWQAALFVLHNIRRQICLKPLNWQHCRVAPNNEYSAWWSKKTSIGFNNPASVAVSHTYWTQVFEFSLWILEVHGRGIENITVLLPMEFKANHTRVMQGKY